MSRKPEGKQYKMLAVIREFIDAYKYSPSMRYLMVKMDFKSLSTVDYYLRMLEKEGLIRREPHLSRSITITGSVPEPEFIKLDGRRMNSYQKKTHGKGVGIVIHGKIESKRDPFLQQRIDLVVARAQEREHDHCTDVVHEYYKLQRSNGGLKVHRVG